MRSICRLQEYQFMRVYNSNQAMGNRVTEQLTAPYKALEDELQKVTELQRAYEKAQSQSKQNVNAVRAVETYEANRKEIEAVIAQEEKYQKYIERTEKAIDTLKAKLKAKNDEARQWEIANVGNKDAVNPFKTVNVELDSHIQGWRKAIENTRNKIAGKRLTRILSLLSSRVYSL